MLLTDPPLSPCMCLSKITRGEKLVEKKCVSVHAVTLVQEYMKLGYRLGYKMIGGSEFDRFGEQVCGVWDLVVV